MYSPSRTMPRRSSRRRTPAAILVVSKLDGTIERRQAIADAIDRGIARTATVFPVAPPAGSSPSKYFHTVGVRTDRLRVPKEEFARAVREEGFSINPHYMFVVADWPWVTDHLEGPRDTPVARAFRDSSFNILYNENYTLREVEDLVEAILKVEAVMAR